MTGPTIWLVMIGAEVVLVLLALLSFSWLRSRRLTRRDRKAMQALIAQVTQTKAQRETAIRQLLSERFKLSDDLLEASTSAILREEMLLYQRFANLYAKRDAGAAKRFNIILEAGLAPYWALPEQQVAVADDPVEPIAADSEAIARLIRENQDLRSELQVTMDTMTRMLDEYATMFGSGSVEALTEPNAGGESAAAAGPAGDAQASALPIDDGAESLGDASQPDENLASAETEFQSGGEPVSNAATAGSVPGPDVASSEQPTGTSMDQAPRELGEAGIAEPEALAADDDDAAPVTSDADADALLAEALEGADLVADDLDGLFDDEEIDELDDDNATADLSDFQDEKSISI